MSVQFVAVSMAHGMAGSNLRIAPVSGPGVSAIRPRIIYSCNRPVEVGIVTREVALPEGVRGALHLSPMPGRYEPIDESILRIGRLRIDRVVSLAPQAEIEEKSPDYRRILRDGCPGFVFDCIPVEDFGGPRDRAVYAGGVERTASAIAGGARVLVHCGAGIGRTGTFAICLLKALGMKHGDAVETVLAAGSRPETPEQNALAEWFSPRPRDEVRPPSR